MLHAVLQREEEFSLVSLQVQPQLDLAARKGPVIDCFASHYFKNYLQLIQRCPQFSPVLMNRGCTKKGAVPCCVGSNLFADACDLMGNVPNYSLAFAHL
jgi:hypothetical protein